MKTKYILASRSPQRKAILKAVGVPFRVFAAHTEERHDGLTRPHAIVKRLAQKKAWAASANHPEPWVIGCDTIVVLSDGSVALKPKNRSEATRMIQNYSDSFCDVYSGLCILNRNKGAMKLGYEKTRIHFRKLKVKEIEAYLESGDWKDRSGAMTIEGSGHWMRKMEGSYWNVVGFPLNLFKRLTAS